MVVSYGRPKLVSEGSECPRALPAEMTLRRVVSCTPPKFNTVLWNFMPIHYGLELQTLLEEYPVHDLGGAGGGVGATVVALRRVACS